jgi:hypothetical protein
MRKVPAIFVFLSLVSVWPAVGQQSSQPASAGSNWARVQVLPAGKTINVKTKDRHMVCKLVSVDADMLRCSDHAKDVTFQRAEIVSVKIPRRGRSTLIGFGIGAGTGAVIGFAGATNSGNGFFGANFMRGAVTAVFGVVGGVIGAPVGYATDFSRSTVYKAP